MVLKVHPIWPCPSPVIVSCDLAQPTVRKGSYPDGLDLIPRAFQKQSLFSRYYQKGKSKRLQVWHKGGSPLGWHRPPGKTLRAASRREVTARRQQGPQSFNCQEIPANNLRELGEGSFPGRSHPPRWDTADNTLISALGDPEQKPQLKHMRPRAEAPNPWKWGDTTFSSKVVLPPSLWWFVTQQ